MILSQNCFREYLHVKYGFPSLGEKRGKEKKEKKKKDKTKGIGNWEKCR